MSRVYLLRHAKAASAMPGMKDFDRPLDARGREMAGKLGGIMLANGLVPDRIVASPSARTRETLETVMAALPFEIDTVFERSLYDGDDNAYLSAIIRAGEAGSIMLVGHNPMTEEAALRLCGTGEPAAMSILQHGFPTGGLAVIELPGTLSQAKQKSGHLALFITGGEL